MVASDRVRSDNRVRKPPPSRLVEEVQERHTKILGAELATQPRRSLLGMYCPMHNNKLIPVQGNCVTVQEKQAEDGKSKRDYLRDPGDIRLPEADAESPHFKFYEVIRWCKYATRPGSIEEISCTHPKPYQE